MTSIVSTASIICRSVIDTVRDDLREDRYLRWILILAILTAGAFVWYRLPNFVAPDEYSRILKPMKVAGRMSQEGLGGLRTALLEDRALGPTVYLYALALVPVFVIVLLTGSIDQFTGLAAITSRWELWQAAPAWFWTWSILFSRLWSVLFVVATVYVVYRTCVEAYDRVAGRYAAILLSLSLGSIEVAHEAGEDAPLLFLTAVIIYLSIRYVRSGNRQLFFIGCAVGGLATAFKFSGGIAAVLLGSAYLVRTVSNSDERLVDIRLLAGGLVIAFALFYVGFAAVVFGGPGVLYDRLTNEFTRHIVGDGTETTLPFFGFGVLRAYLSGLGLPLFILVVAGIATRLRRLSDGWTNAVPELVIGPALAGFCGVFLISGNPATVHLLPTYAMLLVLTGGAMAAWHTHGRSGTRVLMAVMIVLAAVFAGGGLLVFAQEPRDSATATIAAATDPDDTVAMYRNSIPDVGAVHGQPLDRYDYNEANVTGSLIRNESNYTHWMITSPDREPAVIQLTCSGEISYLKTENVRQYPDRAAFVNDLLSEDVYDYRIIAQHGRSPQAYLDKKKQSPIEQLVAVGTNPQPSHTEPCVVLLERTE